MPTDLPEPPGIPLEMIDWCKKEVNRITGIAHAMKIDYEEQRLARRATSIAMSCAAQACGYPAFGSLDRDQRDRIKANAEHAAYLAIMEERRHHAADMAELKRWREQQVEGLSHIAPRVTVTKEELAAMYPREEPKT